MFRQKFGNGRTDEWEEENIHYAASGEFDLVHNYNDATQCQPASETVSHTKHVIIIIIIVVVIISNATTTIMLSVLLLASLIHRCIMFLSNDKQFTSNPDLSLTSCDLDL